MRVKLFTANNIQEAMAKVKSELGRDAVILHTRRFRKGGFFGFCSKEMVEVTAAVENTNIATVEKVVPPPPDINHNINETRTTAMHLEMANMRKMLEQLMHRMPTINRKKSELLELLLKNDVDEQIAENLLQGLPEEKPVLINDKSVIRQLLLDRVAKYLSKIDGIRVSNDECKKVAFIGPTGVGKTTTIAKLAANFALKKGYRVALITADTYRIAAVEQLKTYADIIGVPIEIVYTPDELKAAIYRHRDKNLVLIDTAGRSPHNTYQISDLQAFLSVDPCIETHLVLSTTTKYKDALEIVNSFSVCSPQKFLFTKIDEASNLGIILNLLYQYPTTLSYVTTGQNVPDDIELANIIKLADSILRD